MASHPLNFFRLFVVLFLHCLLRTAEAFPSYYYLADDEAGVDQSVSDTEDIAQFHVSLHGYGNPSEEEDQNSLANKIKEKLLRLRRPSLHSPMKRQQAWTNGYGKRQQDWFATYGKRDRGISVGKHHIAQRGTVPKRQNGWSIGYGRK